MRLGVLSWARENANQIHLSWCETCWPPCDRTRDIIVLFRGRNRARTMELIVSVEPCAACCLQHCISVHIFAVFTESPTPVPHSARKVGGSVG